MTNIKQNNLNFIKKEINFLPFEIKEKKNQFEKLKLEVHNKKKLHNEKIEKYKFIINNIKINEKKIEEKNLLIDKIKNKQKLILNAINEGFFNFFKQTIQFSNEKILEGFFMFLKYKKNQIKFINNKEDLFNILSKSYENIFLLENEKFFFELKNKINEIENKYINIYFISSKSDEIYNNNLTKNKITYTDYIHLYLGFLTQLIGREKLQESPIKFFTINENFSVQNLELSELSIDQKLIYQLIINIPFTQKIINDISQIIFKWFNDSRTIMDKTLNVFSIIIFILNIFVMILYFIYVNIYVILFNEKFNFFIEKFKNKEFVYYFNSKINFLRLLVQLYEKNPINEINNITKNKREYDKYLEKKRIKNSKEFEETEFIKDDLKKTYKNKNIFIYYYLILLLYYFIDFIIFIILYFVLIKNNHELKILIEYHNLSIDLDSSIMNNFIDLQYIIYTNITENYIGYLIEGNNISNYLTNNLENMISIINKIQEMETNNNYINEITKDFLNTTCDNVFDLIKDENSQKNKDYYITICKNFGLFEFGNQYFLYKTISYYLFLLFNSIHQIPYEKKYKSINYFDLFGIYNLLLFLVDILRT